MSTSASDAIDGLDDFLVRRLGRFRMVGKTQPIEVYELLCERSLAAIDDVRRCNAFGQALDEFERGRLSSTAEKLEELLLRFPADGPAKFYLNRCRNHVSSADRSRGVIELESK